MPSNFFSKLVRNPQGQGPGANGRASSSEQEVSSPYTPKATRRRSQTISPASSPHLSPYRHDTSTSNSSSSLKIGVIPPSPHQTDSDLSVHASYRPPVEQVHQAALQHRRVRSQDRERSNIIPDRHEVSLAARPPNDIKSFVDETELTPTPGRPFQAPDWASSRSATYSPRLSPGRQLSPASSTGNLRGFVDKQTARSTLLQTPGKAVREKPSKQSIRSATQPPPPPLNIMLSPPTPLPAPVLGSNSTLVNGTKQTEPSLTQSPTAPTLSPNTSFARSDFSDGDTFLSSGDEASSDDELDLNEQDIPVTGFAVASNRRNADFHDLFPNIPEGDYLIEDYGCALQREILIQGRLYISENHICFHANIFGWITDLSIPIYEITGLEKKMTAYVIPNAIQITTRQAKYTFASFLARDTTYDVIVNIWRLARPEESLQVDSRNASSRDMVSTLTTTSEASAKEAVVAGPSKVTHCPCSKNGSHLSEVALETVLPGTPEKIYNLMFASGFIKDFIKVDQKMSDVQISDWAPVGHGANLLKRNMSYIKPLNNSVGPKQTKCELQDETEHCDFDDYVVMVTSTRTPDVPSGGVFTVMTRTCIMWASAITTRVIVTTQVDWSGRSFIKGLIEKSVIEGQKVYHSDLDKAMRMYIQEHQAEFVPEGLDPSAVAPVEPLTPLIGGVSEASLSVQEARKARERDRNLRGMQWAYDTFDGAYHVAERSTRGALELVKEAWEQSSSTTILWFVIVLLVLSNVWTLALVGNREEVGRRKELRRAEEKERWLQGVIAGVWEELAAERARAAGGLTVPLASMPVGDVQAEVTNMGKVLDAVEQRVRTIRENLEGLS